MIRTLKGGSLGFHLVSTYLHDDPLVPVMQGQVWPESQQTVVSSSTNLKAEPGGENKNTFSHRFHPAGRRMTS